MEIKKKKIIIAIMVAMFLAAVEGTVVTTAVPTIVKDLNGFQYISLVFSVYLLTSAITTPIYGKLSDLYGRKNTLTVGILIFLIGSILCGMSKTMTYLIISRAIQGIGAGSIFTVTYTIIGDVFTITERAKVQGSLSTVWGLASLVGPFIGGFFIDNLSWHWIFFINVPFGILSIYLINKNLEESFEKKKHKIDFLGIFVLTLAIVLFLYGFLSKSKGQILFSKTMIISILLSCVLLFIFYFIEKKVDEPIVPFQIFTKTNVIANLICFLIAGFLIAIDVYIPLYTQNVLGFSATIAGISMAPISICWLVSSMLSGKAVIKYGERIVTSVSAALLIIGNLLLTMLNTTSPLYFVIFCGCIIGVGFGGSFTILTIVVQDSVEYNMRGAATASNSLVRTIAQTIGVSIFGSILNINISKYFNNVGIQGIDPSNMYSSTSYSNNIGINHLHSSVGYGIHVLFLCLILINVISLAFSFRLSSNLKENKETI